MSNITSVYGMKQNLAIEENNASLDNSKLYSLSGMGNDGKKLELHVVAYWE